MQDRANVEPITAWISTRIFDVRQFLDSPSFVLTRSGDIPRILNAVRYGRIDFMKSILVDG